MLDHVSIQVKDVAASAAFYEAILAPLGGKKIVEFDGVVGLGRDSAAVLAGADDHHR